MSANTATFLFEVIGSNEAFNVLEFKVSESVSELYNIDVTLATENANIDLSSLLGKAAVLTLLVENHPSRLFHGELVQAQQQESGRRLTTYTFTLAPKFWFLQYRSGCRIFQDKSVTDIIQQLFSEARIEPDDYRLVLSGAYSKREFCVQYHESEYHFLSRLMEEEGIFYYFEHHLDRQVMVITDQTNTFKRIEGGGTIPYHAKTGMRPDHPIIYELAAQRQTVPNEVVVSDYNFEKPSLSLFSQQSSGGSSFSHYHYPGDFDSPAAGQHIAATRLSAYCARGDTLQGKTDQRYLAAGGRFSVSDHENTGLNQEYFALETVIHGKQPQALEEGAGSGGTEFFIEFLAIPNTVDFKAPLIHEKPHLEGIQTAFVVGPEGEEIYTDKFGRIKVQFHWDREGAYNEDASCWVRVSQDNTGNEWGAMAIPRVGQEVIVSFLDGNPDRPIVTGTLFHAVNRTPYDLPAHKTRSGIKTQSYPGGGGYNELRIDDKKGSEQIYVHAEKDFDAYIKNDYKAGIDNDKHTTIEGSHHEATEGDFHQTIGQNTNIKVGSTHSQSIGKDLQLKIGNNQFVQAGREVLQKAGTNLVMEAGMAITLKGGAGLVAIDPSGVCIVGPTVRINSGGSAGPAQSAAPTAPVSPQTPEAGTPGKQTTIKSPSGRKRDGIEFNPGAASDYTLENAPADPLQSTQGANSHTPESALVNLEPEETQDWIKVRARYDDLWQTPLVEAKVNVTVEGAPVIQEQPLQTGTGKNSRATSQAAAEKTQDEPGTLMVAGTPKGKAELAFVSEPGMEQQIDSLRNAIGARLNGAYLDLLEKMSEFQAQWDNYGPASIPMSGAEGLMSGATDWVKDQGDLLEARTWKELGNTIADTANNVWDYTATYARDKFNDIKESVGEANEFIDEATDNFFNWNWWSQQAEEAGDSLEETAVRFIDDVKSDLEQAAETLESSTEKAQKIYHHRHAIMELPQLLAEGNASRVEQFIDNVLMDIEPEIANEIKNNPDWSAVLELIADHDTILTYLAYISLFMEAIPPNFYAYLSGKGGAYVLMEVLLLILCSLLSVGTATAGRIAMLSARLTSLAAKAGQTGRKTQKGAAAIRSLAKSIEDFAAAAQDMHSLGKKLRKARNSNIKVKGSSGTTLEAKKRQEKRNKKCRVCGKENRKTPRHMRGSVEYD